MRLRIELLGPPRWQCQERSGALGPRDAAWIARLAIEGTQDQASLAQLLWPSRPVDNAVGSLKKCFSTLRIATGHPICVGGDQVQLLPSVSIDASERLEDLSTDELLRRSSLLDGCAYPALPRFALWLERKRADGRRHLTNALGSLAARLQQDGQHPAAQTLLERALELDPRLESAWLQLLRLQVMQGHRVAAIDTYRQFEQQMLGCELPIHPEARELLQHAQRESLPALRIPALPLALQRPPRLVGRERQWQAMQRAWDQGAPFLLRGEGGIGKTRLMQDFARLQAGVLIVDSRPGDEQSACLLLKRVLRAVLRRHEVVLDDALVRQQLSRLLDEFGPPPLGTTVQEEALWEAGEHLLLAAANQGLGAILVDNLHFADLSSVKALRWLVASSELSALRFGFTTRNELRPELQAIIDAWLADPRRPMPVDLTPLSEADLARLIDSLELPGRLPGSLAGALRTYAGGIPYLSIEALIDVLQQQDVDAAQLRLSVPASIVPLLRPRLQAVPPAHAELLWMAALMGGDFTVARAAAVLQLDAAALGEGLLALARCRVFSGPGFEHDLLRECALLEVPPALRPLLHARLATALADDPGIGPARLAHYWEAAENWTAAARCLQAAATSARITGQLHAQQALLERAAECWQKAADTEAAFNARYQHAGGALVLSGAQAALDEAKRLQALAQTPAQQAQVMLLQADALAHLGDNEKALDAAEAVLGRVTDDTRMRIEALMVRTTALAQAGRLAEALSAQESADDLAAGHGDADQQLRLAHLRVVTMFHNGLIGHAVTAARKAAELTRAAGNLVEAVQVDGNLCTLLMVCGDSAEAYRLARSLRQQHETLGSTTNSHTRGLNLIALGNSASWFGHLDEALEALQAAAAVLGDASAAQPRAIQRMSTAYLWLTLGDSQQAAQALPDEPESLTPGMQMRWHWVRARVAAMEGRPADAEYDAIGAVQAAHPQLPQGQSAWIEWSWQGRAPEVVARLREIRRDALEAGMTGFARATMVRELDRLNGMADATALPVAVELARELADVEAGPMSFHIYTPHAWLVLAHTWQRAGQPARAAEARARGRAWVLRAVGRLPAWLRTAFLSHNPFNRDLLAR